MKFCQPASYVMDDQVLLAPREHAHWIFNSSHRATRELVARLGLCPVSFPWMACYQTALLVEHRVRILPAPLTFTIARKSAGLGGSSTPHAGLFLDSGLIGPGTHNASLVCTAA